MKKKLEKKPTKFSHVSICVTDQPAMIQSDLSIINLDALGSTTKTSDNEPAAASVLMKWMDGQQYSSEVGRKFLKEKESMSDESTLFAARFPVMDLPVKQLIIFERLRANYVDTHPHYENKVNMIKNFYTNALRKQRDRVVIESTRRPHAWEEGPREIIIAVKDKWDMVPESFIQTTEFKLTE